MLSDSRAKDTDQKITIKPLMLVGSVLSTTIQAWVNDAIAGNTLTQ